MPTRTQQSDITICAYASHGDTKQVLLIPSTPAECFEYMGKAFDLAERLQTPVIVLLDLDLGMNDHLSDPLSWNENRSYDRGKVLDAASLDNGTVFGRYLDVDGDGISYRTIPGTHPTKGAFFTRGTSRDEYARYTEDGEAYTRNMQKLVRKWNTAKTMVPKPVMWPAEKPTSNGILFFGTTLYPALEAMDALSEKGIMMDSLCVKAFPFGTEVNDFIEKHDKIFVIEQNRDAQFRSLLINELDTDPKKMIRILNYDGLPITADNIVNQISAAHLTSLNAN